MIESQLPEGVFVCASICLSISLSPSQSLENINLSLHPYGLPRAQSSTTPMLETLRSSRMVARNLGSFKLFLFSTLVWPTVAVKIST